MDGESKKILCGKCTTINSQPPCPHQWRENRQKHQISEGIETQNLLLQHARKFSRSTQLHTQIMHTCLLVLLMFLWPEVVLDLENEVTKAKNLSPLPPHKSQEQWYVTSIYFPYSSMEELTKICVGVT